MKHTLPILLLLAVALAACAPSGGLTASPGTLLVDTRSSLGPISPLVYGSNYGPWVAVPYAMLPDAEKAGITFIRFPAGSWGDNNNVTPTQIDQLMSFCKMIGAVPSISVRLKNGTPEVAAALVRYANIENHYGVKYWSIGNEPDLYTKEMNANYDTARFNKDWRQIAEAMKAVDPTIKLLGPEISQYTGNAGANAKDAEGRDWMTEFLKANGDIVDVVTIHRYPFPANGGRQATTIEDLRKNSAEWDAIIPDLRNLIKKTTGHDIPIGVTEINSHWSKAAGGPADPGSLYNAVWWADVLGRMIYQNVFMVNQWMLTSSGGQGAWGLIGRGELRPAYYDYQLYQKFGTDRVAAASGVANLSVYAATRPDGALTLMLVNLADGEQSATLDLKGKTPKSAEAWVLDATRQATPVEAGTILSNGKVTLPGQSVTLVVIQ